MIRDQQSAEKNCGNGCVMFRPRSTIIPRESTAKNDGSLVPRNVYAAESMTDSRLPAHCDPTGPVDALAQGDRRCMQLDRHVRCVQAFKLWPPGTIA